MLLNYESLRMMFVTAVNAAIRAGSKIMEVYESGEISVEAKSDLTPLTFADTCAHDEIKKYLGITRIPVISEEGRSIAYDERASWDLFWMVDPLDGTDEFISRTSDFTVNIALIENGYPVLGVVYAPAYERLYYAGEGYGAFRKTNVKPNIQQPLSYEQIRSESQQMPVFDTGDRFVVVTSRLHISPETSEYVNNLRKQHENILVVRRGSSMKMCMLAVGKADIYPRMNTTWEWDTAASQIIAEEAGFAVVSADDGSRLAYNKEDMRNPWFVCKKK